MNAYEYTPWGEIRNETETVDNPIKYAGEYYDDELDMIYLRARYYNPQIGRFTSLDIEEGEIARPLDMNRYVYCRNNPIRYLDPSGKSVTLTIGGITIAGAAIVKGIVYVAGAAAGLIMAADLGKKVGEVLKTRLGKIYRAPLPPGFPGWDAIRDLTMAEILRQAQKGDKAYKEIWKLLTDGRFKK